MTEEGRTEPQGLPQGAPLVLLAAVTMFSAGVVLATAWLTIAIQDAFDPCVGGCGGVVRAVFWSAAIVEVLILALAVRFAYRPGTAMAARVGVLIAAAVAAPVVMLAGAYIGNVAA